MSYGHIKEPKRGIPKDNLTLDAIDAERAGMSYGNYKALHPNTAFANEHRLGKRLDATQTGTVKSVYTKVCPVCGKTFTCKNKARVYCDDQCRINGGAKWNNPSTKKKEK